MTVVDVVPVIDIVPEEDTDGDCVGDKVPDEVPDSFCDPVRVLVSEPD